MPPLAAAGSMIGMPDASLTRRALVEVAASASAPPNDPIVRRYRLARVPVYIKPEPAPERFAHTRRSPH